MTMNDTIDCLGKKFAVFQKKMDKQKLNCCKEAADVICAAKSEMQRLCTDLQRQSEKEKPLFYSRLILAQKSFAKRKEQIKAKPCKSAAQNTRIQEKAEAKQAAEYADFAIDCAMIAIEEATLSFYDAVEKAEKYVQQYGDEP